MRRLALLVLVGGCELIADIPDPTVIALDANSDGATADMAPPECMDNSACTMIGKPICDLTTHRCGGCVLDSECPSNVCLMDGTCADPARFVYAAAGGNDVQCTMALPCSVDTAVTKLTVAQDIVKLAPGVYTRAASLEMSIAGTIAGGGSTFNVSGPAGTFGIVPTGVPVRVIGLTMNVAANNMAVRCVTAGGEIHLARMAITGGNGAILSTMCPVEIDRTSVSGAANYGLYANGAPMVTIRNSYFVGIASALPDYTIAAVHLNSVPAGTIEHTTIANNGAEGPAGLRCPGSTVTIRNIIAWNNTAPGIDAACVVGSSVVDAGYTGGSGNMSIDPMFVNPAANNFHLMMSSPAKGLGTKDAMYGIDGDGEDRPQPPGSNPDPGADEIP